MTWLQHILPLIAEYKDGDVDPLDGDDVDRFCDIIKAKVNLHEGNITEEEYNELLDGKPTVWSDNRTTGKSKPEEICTALREMVSDGLIDVGVRSNGEIVFSAPPEDNFELAEEGE